MWSFISFLLGFLGKVFSKPAPNAAQAVTGVANTEGQASAQIARQTSTDLHKELTDEQKQTNAAVATVHDADGLRGVSDAVNDAIRRANDAGGV